MRIDYDEMKKILNIFLDSPHAFITLKDTGILEVNDEQEEILLFTLLLMVENGLISNDELETGSPSCIGIHMTNSTPRVNSARKIRLTQNGHDFASALAQKPILERIKKEFADAPFDVVKDVSKSMLAKFFKDKLGLE
ncbi:DUF2513 domain-containing protein [Edwardsiella anguillarum]|uniref:DUF2513 domain-containing protein n=1 Tax=Edwardsiella anguillarum ET080813 TaxID=667120 RepID=A0A076LMY3_9GAMM|nr:DUF2513 domain-containing protein [Edwardsiella anguillarum]AIJ09281.1 Hypothetical protein ETEE_2848 [Edwardsiella anguillarum ET080813]KAB0589414.1 DUF2513 domain-containing protein [Edwardsiella anguillarum]